LRSHPEDSRAGRNNTQMKTVAIVPAAGVGKRLKLKTRKPFVLLGGRPLIARTLSALNSSKFIDAIIVAAEGPCIVSKYSLAKVIKVVKGGKFRFDSVRSCIEACGNGFDIALIHDGARPFVSGRIIRDSVLAARKFGAAIAAMPENDTVKLSDGRQFIKKTLDRRSIYRAQTPQAFKFSLIKKAYSRRIRRNATDDAALIEDMGKRVRIVEGSYSNIKITTVEDLKIAEGLLCG